MNFKTYVPQSKVLNRIHSKALTKWCKLSKDLHIVDLNILKWTNETHARKFYFCVKRKGLRALISPIKLKPPAVKYQSPTQAMIFLDTPQVSGDTSHFLTFLISHMPNVEEFLDHVHSTKSLTSPSAYWYLCAIRKGVYRCVMNIFMQW